MLSDAEAELLQLVAAAAGISQSDWVRQAIHVAARKLVKENQ